MDFPELTEAKVITIKPGDVIAVRSKHDLTHEEADKIRHQMSGVFGCPVIILSDYLAIDVLHEEVSA